MDGIAEPAPGGSERARGQSPWMFAAQGDGGHMCYLLPFRSRDKAARIIF